MKFAQFCKHAVLKPLHGPVLIPMPNNVFVGTFKTLNAQTANPTSTLSVIKV